LAITDENDDVVRVISLVSNSTTATITLPTGSQAHALAINSAGTMAAARLSAKASVALIDLTLNKGGGWNGLLSEPHGVFGIQPPGYEQRQRHGVGDRHHQQTVAQALNVGFGARGIGIAGNTAVVANIQAGSISISI
jgi:hypothetical protein